jgi:hypothetical protein
LLAADASADGNVKIMAHLGHFARLPAISSVTRKGVAHPGQAYGVAMVGPSPGETTDLKNASRHCNASAAASAMRKS